MADHDTHDHTGVPGVGAPTEILDIPTAETDTSLRLAPDGAGGVEWGSAGGAGLAFDYAAVATDQAATSTSVYSDLATTGPAVTVTVNTKVKVTISYDGYDAASGNAFGRMGVALSSGNTVAADDAQSLALGSHTTGDSTMASRVIYYSGLTPGSTVFTAKYYGSSTNFHFRRREILVECMD